MKLIHCGDLHLDSKMETNFTKETAEERRLELVTAFEKMVNYGIAEGVKVIIIAGDLFDTPMDKQKKIKNRVIEIMKRAEGIDFIYLQGNHDKADIGLIKDVLPENIKIIGEGWTYFRYHNVVITGCRLEKNVKDNIYDSLVLREEDVNIAVLHGTLADGQNNKDSTVININNLKNKYIDYLALGHIHQRREFSIDRRGYGAYCGCLEGRSFDECGSKGFIVLDIEDNKVSNRFVENSIRVCHELPLDLADFGSEEEIREAIGDMLCSISSRDMVKIVLKGERSEELDIDINYLKRGYEDEYYLFKIKDKSTIKIDYDSYKNEISLKGEFIRVVGQTQLEDEVKAKIIEAGIRALRMENI